MQSNTMATRVRRRLRRFPWSGYSDPLWRDPQLYVGLTLGVILFALILARGRATATSPAALVACPWIWGAFISGWRGDAK